MYQASLVKRSCANIVKSLLLQQGYKTRLLHQFNIYNISTCFKFGRNLLESFGINDVSINSISINNALSYYLMGTEIIIESIRFQHIS